ncbi:glycosyltransferase [Candidatus Woesearchaeota archaeon]|nr:glycosyltransferase [Candidatus Woesearchaeota archaeon]
MSPDVSIIIPAYNEEKYIEKTLQSIQDQTFKDYETIIVTNGCTDKTEEIVKKKLSDTIRHLSLPKPNVCVARNAGALNAQGKILLFLDADTQLASDSLEKIKEQFTSECSVASTKSLPDTLKLKYQLIHHLKNAYNSFIYQGCSGVLVCRKDDFQNVGGYNPEIIIKEHHILTRALAKLGKYKCINTKVTTSTRRFKQWGLAKTAAFWIKQTWNDKFGNLKDIVYEKVR